MENDANNGVDEARLNEHSNLPVHTSQRETRKNFINDGQEDQMEITGYRSHSVKTVFTWLLIVLTLGILRLVFYWRPHWMLMSTHVTCSLHTATAVLLKDQYNQWFVEKVKTVNTNNKHQVNAAMDIAHETYFQLHHRFFYNKKIKYMWMAAETEFHKLSVATNIPLSYFHETRGLSVDEQQRRLRFYGTNSFRLHVTSIGKLLLTQGLHPFYIFQVFSCLLWFIDGYIYYASAIIIISMGSLLLQLYDTRKNQRTLKRKVNSSGCVTVYRENGAYEEMSSEDLAPGDIIAVPALGCTLHCDAVLVTGVCTVDESMLTGESVPVTKVPLPNPKLLSTGDSEVTFSMKEHSRHVLYCGTAVVQTRCSPHERVHAVVLRTGYMTAKGEMVRSILYPKPVNFKFTQDAFKWVGVLLFIALIGMAYTITLLVQRGEDIKWILRRSLDVITIVIPPALPAAMTIGIVYAQKRLKSHDIFCINSSMINVGGIIDLFCFDKTGTLTEDGLDLCAVISASDGRFAEQSNVSQLDNHELVVAMATCHSLTTLNGTIVGDPLDVHMFEATGWELNMSDDSVSSYGVFMSAVVRPRITDGLHAVSEVGIMRQLTFSSSLQRMSVVTQSLTAHHFCLYTKGSPEVVTRLSRPDTVPDNFAQVLRQYTQQGYRVIALAYRPLNLYTADTLQNIDRAQLECDLTFLGLLVMENKLKPQSAAVIGQLQSANIRTVMVTGDNILTAVSVARASGMITHGSRVTVAHVTPPVTGKAAHIHWKFIDCPSSPDKLDIPVTIEGKQVYIAVSGHSWSLLRQYLPDMIPQIAVQGVIFARMSPEQKQQLIEVLQSLGYYVGMCGDGANDCGALKTAHTGISLSQAEASVASPFTSKQRSVTCVPTVIREGRAALVTSFGIFKYMAMYSMTQFTTMCILFWGQANVSDPQFLYCDLFLITSLSITFGYTKAYRDLWPEPPPASLVAMKPILSLITQVILMVTVQVFVNQMTVAQPWFEPFEPNREDLKDYSTCYQCNTVFGVSMFIYISAAVVFAQGKPYRKPIYTNYLFLINVLICYVTSFLVIVYPMDFVLHFMRAQRIPSVQFCYLIVGIGIMHLITSTIIEMFVVDGRLTTRLQQHCKTKVLKSKIKTEHERIAEHIEASNDWPPQGQVFDTMDELL